MTEDEWHTCGDAGPMLAWLQKAGRLAPRKMRLFLCALERHRIEPRAPRTIRFLSAVEELSDGNWVERELRSERSSLIHDLVLAVFGSRGEEDREALMRFRAILCLSDFDPSTVRGNGDLARELFGNPFRKARQVSARLAQRVTTLPPERRPRDLLFTRDWLVWHRGLIPQLARGIIADRAFDRLTILGDALEDAGCTDSPLLDHCRHGGPHALGCWALDLILGKD